MAGHKVGFITQSETKASKCKGKNKTSLFERHLSRVYSLATWTEFDVDSDLHSDNKLDRDTLYQTWILSLHEERMKPCKSRKSDHDVKMSMVALCPQNGDIVWDYWNDGQMRSRLETLMTYFKPHEIILPLKGLSVSSETLVHWLIRQSVQFPFRSQAYAFGLATS